MLTEILTHTCELPLGCENGASRTGAEEAFGLQGPLLNFKV